MKRRNKETEKDSTPMKQKRNTCKKERKWE